MIRAVDPSRRAQKQFLKLDAGKEMAFGPIFLNIGAGWKVRMLGLFTGTEQPGETRRGGHSLEMWL